MSAWIEWNGGERPVPFNKPVDWRLRNGQEFSGLEYPRFVHDWTHDPKRPDNDIVAYRLAEMP